MRQQARVGEFVLRILRRESRDKGHKRFLSRLFKDQDEKYIAEAILEEEIAKKVGEAAGFLAIFQWLIEHQEEILAFIEMLIALFGGMSQEER